MARTLAPVKYLGVMIVVWCCMAAVAVVVPGIIALSVMWFYCNVDKRKAPDHEKATWVRTTRECRRRIVVARGIWMPFLVGAPLVLVGIGISFLVGHPALQSADPYSNHPGSVMPFVIIVSISLAVMFALISRKPKNGWGGRQPLVRTTAVVLHGEVVSGEVVS